MHRSSQKRKSFGLSTNKRRELFELQLQKAGMTSQGALNISRRRNEDALLLSFAQQRLWFLDQWEPGSPLYNVPLAVQFDGSLQISILAKCLQRIVERHEVLRTTFSNQQGLPLQVIAPSSLVHLPIIELSNLSSPHSWSIARHLAGQEALLPFDLERGPLLRAWLLRLSSQEHVLLLSLHHIITDGWSMGILLQELGSLYKSAIEQHPDPLADLSLQYADYALWQRNWLQGEVLEQQLGYWRENLAHLPVLDLPTDHPRPPIQSHWGAAQTFLIPLSLLEQLRRLSKQEGVTLFMTLLAGFQCLLARYSGQQDIAVGTPIANRPHPELEGLIGCFLNTLVLRTDLIGNPSFRQVLGRVRESCLGAYAHQDLPFERLVEELEPERDLSRPALAQVLLVLQNAPTSALPLPGLKLRALEQEVKHTTAKFDLTLSLLESDQGLLGSMEYRKDLFEEETIKRLLGHLRTLLEMVVADPERRIGEIPLLTEQEHIQILELWNATGRSFPERQSISQLFEEQVARCPEAVALVCEEQQMTYEALNEQANQLGHYLRELGVGPEVRVGLCLPRSVELLIGLLAVLKAGGAYVPLDPDAPQERLAFMIQDVQAKVVLTQEQYYDSVSVQGERECPVICLDTNKEVIARQDTENLRNSVHAENCAYVIYTSGSTGQPKGVDVPHRAVSRLVFNTNYIQLEGTDRVAHASNIAFDASTFEVWGALLHGAQLVILSKNTVLTPQKLTSTLYEQSITTFFLTTALFNLLAREVPTVFRTIRHLLFGGEAVEPRWVRRVLQAGPPERLLHVYGPTESTTFASWYLVQGLAEAVGTVPIGSPISNTQFYVLDTFSKPVPVGVPGELYIGGAGLARGYWNRPELTADRFVPDPFNWEHGARLYRTGDLVRYLADGSLEYLGRTDNQIKLRGFRIELGEIEAVLRTHPTVREAIVMMREDVPSDKRLVAYLIHNDLQDGLEENQLSEIHKQEFQSSDATNTLWFEQLYAFLQERLPSYMVPTTFVPINTLPLTSHGKIDRKQLPVPESFGLKTREHTSPKNMLEYRLCLIWKEILGAQDIGITNNFFALGGHSLLAVQLISRIREIFGVALSLSAFFNNPTIEALAITLQQPKEASAHVSSLLLLRPGASNHPLFLIHPRDGQVGCYSDVTHYLNSERPIYGLQARGLDPEQELHTSIEDMASYYLSLIRSVQIEGPYDLGGYSLGGLIAFEMAQQLQAQNQSIGLLALLDCPPVNTHVKLSKVNEAEFLFNHFSRYLPVTLDDLQALEPDEQLAHILNLAQQAGLMSSAAGVDLSLMRRMVQILKVHERAYEAYIPHTYRGHVAFFSCQDTFDNNLQDPTLGWSDLATEGVELQVVPGAHLTMMYEPHAQVLSQSLDQYL